MADHRYSHPVPHKPTELRISRPSVYATSLVTAWARASASVYCPWPVLNLYSVFPAGTSMGKAPTPAISKTLADQAQDSLHVNISIIALCASGCHLMLVANEPWF